MEVPSSCTSSTRGQYGSIVAEGAIEMTAREMIVRILQLTKKTGVDIEVIIGHDSMTYDLKKSSVCLSSYRGKGPEIYIDLDEFRTP